MFVLIFFIFPFMNIEPLPCSWIFLRSKTREMFSWSKPWDESLGIPFEFTGYFTLHARGIRRYSSSFWVSWNPSSDRWWSKICDASIYGISALGLICTTILPFMDIRGARTVPGIEMHFHLCLSILIAQILLLAKESFPMLFCGLVIVFMGNEEDARIVWKTNRRKYGICRSDAEYLSSTFECSVG